MMPATPPASLMPNGPARDSAPRGTPADAEPRSAEFAAQVRQERNREGRASRDANASGETATLCSGEAPPMISRQTFAAGDVSAANTDADPIIMVSGGVPTSAHSASPAQLPAATNPSSVATSAPELSGVSVVSATGRLVLAGSPPASLPQQAPVPGPTMPTHIRPAPDSASETSMRAAPAGPTSGPTDASFTPFVAATGSERSAPVGAAETTATPNTLPTPSLTAQPAQGQTAATTAPAPTPLPAAPTTQLAQAILARGTPDTLEVRLDPPSLGQVRVSFDFGGDVPRAVVAAAQAETLDQLRRGASALLLELAEAGLGDTELTWSDERLPPGEQSAAARPIFLATDHGEVLQADALPPLPRRHDGVLDLTL